MTKMWVAILDKYAPNCKLYYSAVEEGCKLYWTNDLQEIFFDQKYLIDFMEDKNQKQAEKELHLEYGANYMTEEQLKEWGSKVFNLKNPTVKDIKKRFDKYIDDHDYQINWNEFEYEPA